MRGTRVLVPATLLAVTGLRRGEVLALRWSEVNLDTGAVRVRSTLRRTRGPLVLGAVKTNNGFRTVHVSPGMTATLREHRVQQTAAQLAARLWTDNDLVFPTTRGTFWEPRNFLRDYSAVAKGLGLSTKVHTLRHTAVYLAQGAGTDLTSLSRVIGHADPMSTLRNYGHSDSSRERAVSLSIGDALGL